MTGLDHWYNNGLSPNFSCGDLRIISIIILSAYEEEVRGSYKIDDIRSHYPS